MARIRRSVEPYSFVPSNLEQTFPSGSAGPSGDGGEFAHALFAPIRYEPGYGYPLIVWLHGCGGDERQLPRMMPCLSLRNYVAAAPRGLPLAGGDGAHRRGFGWQQTVDHIQSAQQRVFDCVELAGRQFHVAPGRVFLMGNDAGGTMALRIALSNPDRFAGAISLCGAFPSGGAPLGNLLAARRLAVFLAADRESLCYPASQVCSDLRLLHSAGLSVTLRQYPRGQRLIAQMLADVDRWIIDEITAPRRPAVEANAEWSREIES
jgi:phospholipase/carboxylesterase